MAWAINRGGKNSVCNLQYGPRTQLVRGIYFVDCFLFTEIAQANGGNDVEEAVITVPLHFSDKQRTAIRYFINIVNMGVKKVNQQ